MTTSTRGADRGRPNDAVRRIGPETTTIEASSGSTAVSEACCARMPGLRFIAVVPAGTAAPRLDRCPAESAMRDFPGGAA